MLKGDGYNAIGTDPNNTYRMRALIEKHASIPGKRGEMKRLEEEIRQFLTEWGAISIGFATLETLAGGPPSSDLAYILPEAKSAVSFALPLDPDGIRAKLAKESNNGYTKNYHEVEAKATGIADKLANWLEEKGYKAKVKRRRERWKRIRFCS